MSLLKDEPRILIFLLLAICFIIASVFISTISYHIPDANAAEITTSEVVVPDEVQFQSKKKPMKIFDHKGHVENLNGNCVECHHIGDVNAKCLSCHNVDNPDVGKIIGSKKTFHGNCVTCHKTIAKEAGTKSKCSDCHLRKKKRIQLEGC